jgi:hypothetical protein
VLAAERPLGAGGLRVLRWFEDLADPRLVGVAWDQLTDSAYDPERVQLGLMQYLAESWDDDRARELAADFAACTRSSNWTCRPP